MSQVETALFWITTALYAAGWLAALGGAVFRNARAGKAGLGLLAAGLATHTAAIAVRWAATGHGPVMRDFENATAGSWVVMGIALLLSVRRRGLRALVLIATPGALVLLGYGLTRTPELEPLSPALKTPWMYIHVLFAWVSFGSFSVASAAAAVFLAKDFRLRRQATAFTGTTTDAPAPDRQMAADPPGGDGPLASLDELQFRLITYGFVAAAVMIASGSIWARLLWGSYWGWDPVETWSLASWLVYGLYIHLRVTFGWKMRKAAWFALFAIVPVLISFWGVGFALTSRHLFAMMDLVGR